MSGKKSSKFGRLRAFFAGFLVLIGLLTGVSGLNASPVSAIPDPGEIFPDMRETSGSNETSTDETTTNVTTTDETSADETEITDDIDDETEETEESTEEESTEKKQDGEKATSENDCRNNLGSMEWVICAITDKVSSATDFLYKMIEGMLVINPVPAEDGSPIYEIWKYFRGLTNIIFIIFLLVVIYSQITGVGITNYGLKKALPKLIIAAVLVNLSFLICSIAVDASNILGDSLRNTFKAVEESTLATSDLPGDGETIYSQIYATMAGGSALAIGGAVIAFEAGSIWMFIPLVLGAVVSVASGLITIALRQAVVVLLIMISPLAMVANILPNTEQWFKKWKDLLLKMLIFYPMFSLLFGASNLAGLAIMLSASDGFGVLLGAAVQVFPLFFAWSMMKMSGTFLGAINAKMNQLASGPLASSRAFAESQKMATRQKNLAKDKVYTPSLALSQFLSNRKIAQDERVAGYATTIKNRGLAYAASKKYKNGIPTKEAEEEYEAQARNMRYEGIVERHKSNMNKGLGQLEAVKANVTGAQKARLDNLDNANVNAADALFAEKARSEMIEYGNAMDRHGRFERAINAHFDPNNAGQVEELVRYNALHQIMEGNDNDVQFSAAAAARGYDAQKQIYDSKMQKYFELIPPTHDVDNRLTDLTSKPGAALNIDAIVSGLRVLNQRGDTDIVKKQIDNILDKSRGGGIEVGTHASQALASFLMFEVKGSDPFLRRFGKYINLETARAFSEGERKELSITYDEYLKGYHIEPDGSKMYAKKDVIKLMEGTSFDEIERTTFNSFDESLKKAYGINGSNDDDEIKNYLNRRKAIQKSFEPAFLSSSMKWLSGSEQINSAVKYWTGYGMKQKKDANGKVMLDSEGNIAYEYVPVWEEPAFAGHEAEVEQFYRARTMEFFKDQTTGQILNMRTDYRDPTMNQLLAAYLDDSSEDETSDERKQKYNAAVAEIQTRYGDESDPDKAQEKRAADIKALQMELAGRHLRKILGQSGKLKQIYRTRSSGTANNAKDWLRKWVGLDDEKELNKEVNFYERERAKAARANGDQNSDTAEPTPRVYSEDDMERFVNEAAILREQIKDEDTEAFYEDLREKLEEWFGEDTAIEKQYEDYYKVDNLDADNNDLYNKFIELISDLKNYPDA